MPTGGRDRETRALSRWKVDGRAHVRVVLPLPVGVVSSLFPCLLRGFRRFAFRDRAVDRRRRPPLSVAFFLVRIHGPQPATRSARTGSFFFFFLLFHDPSGFVPDPWGEGGPAVSGYGYDRVRWLPVGGGWIVLVPWRRVDGPGQVRGSPFPPGSSRRLRVSRGAGPDCRAVL